MTVIATAGHVDHGKSTLVERLTGTDPDRWDEEKARGLTIDLGFAAVALPSGRRIEFVDVPGHSRFLRNMLAGAGAVRGALLVVSALDGWMAQSEEHYRILELLGVTTGRVVVTHADSVDAEMMEMALLDIADHTAGGPLGVHDPVVVDSITGRGIDHLRNELDAVTDELSHDVDTGRTRLWIDRSFTAKGSGTVVTGTLAGGTLSIDQTVRIEPIGRDVRIRGLQTHFDRVDEIGPGHRVAVNLTGISHREVGRGMALVAPGRWAAVRAADAEFHALPDLRRAVSRRGAHVAYVGSAELPVRIRVLGESSIEPGGHGFVRLHFDRPVPLVPGDRYVLRDSGSGATLGGGDILVLDSPIPAGRAHPTRSVDDVLAQRGPMSVEELERLTGEMRAPTVGHMVMTDDDLDRRRTALDQMVRDADTTGVDIAGLDEIDRELIGTLDGVVTTSGRATLVVRGGAVADDPWLAAATATLLQPPPTDEVDRATLARLRRDGAAVELDGVWFAAAAVPEAARRLAELFELAGWTDDPASPVPGVTVGDIRDAWGNSRKFALPLLGWLDSQGGTRRRGDLRVPGPRLRALAATR